MLKAIFRCSVLLLTLFLSSCDQVTQFTLSEQTINDYLQKRGQYQKKWDVSDVDNVNIVISNLQAQIGRAEPNILVLTSNIYVERVSLVDDKTASTQLQLILKARPSYDQKQGAIYLKDWVLIDYKVTPENAQAIIDEFSPYLTQSLQRYLNQHTVLESAQAIVGSLMPYLNQSLKLYLNEQPIYVLNPEKSNVEALAKKLAKGLEAKPGLLVIPFKD